ncbi:MAG TPA: hypothetical protein VFG58_05375 [Solirubrobacterales bacterium]|nr:hypothetical protein [Solirubrobacterales bacterium]
MAVLVASLAIGQAALALCGVRRWSWPAPAVGLALLCAICWATVRMPGDGAASAAVVVALTAAAALYLRGRSEGGGEALRLGWPVAACALLAASLPFVAEGHFGILGTGFNPDMSQHLLATDRLAHGEGSQLLHQGYPLGPHGIVVALSKGLGVGIVQGFDGLTIAAAAIAPLTALAAFAGQPRARATAAALLVGLPYLVASYFAQGAFKELIQALLVLAFVLALRESTRAWRHLPLRFVPAALLAIGSVYTYSFPGLIWLAGIGAIWAILRWASARSATTAGGGALGGSPTQRRPFFAPKTLSDGHRTQRRKTQQGGDPPNAPTGPAGRHAMSLAVLVFAIGALPELGRMIDFHSFETFDPNGPGLGNLFGQISPFTALGIWPSGDFRLAPGDGAVPAFIYYLGAAFATLLFIFGVRRAWRNREHWLLAGLASVALLYVAARVGGTPYTSAKALEIAAPLLTLCILLPRLSAGGVVGGTTPEDALATAGGGGSPAATGPAVGSWVYLLAAGACSLLALANAPVGPRSYSPALTSLRPLFADSSTLVLAPDRLLADEQGESYIAWELRGGRVCIEPASSARGGPPVGVRFFVTAEPAERPFRGLVLRRRAGPYAVWEHRGVVGGPSPCPLIAVRQARQGP